MDCILELNIPCEKNTTNYCWDWDHSVNNHRVICDLTQMESETEPPWTACRCQEMIERTRFGCCRGYGEGANHECSLDTCWTNEYVMFDASGIPKIPITNGDMIPCCEGEVIKGNDPISRKCKPRCSATFSLQHLSNRTLSGPSRQTK